MTAFVIGALVLCLVLFFGLRRYAAGHPHLTRGLIDG